MKQYVKKEPIKWCFKFCYRCASKTGYLGKSVVLALTECLKSTYCTNFKNSFFNGLSLISNLFSKGVCAGGNAKKNMKSMREITVVQ